MLNKGDLVPEFSLPDEKGEMVSLSDLLESGPLILYFYPADFTPICTSEACNIRDIHDEILDVNIKVVGISPQDSASHARFASKYDLKFPLLFDDSKKVIHSFGVDGLLGIGVRRATFLIGQDNKIVNRVVSDLFVTSHIKFIKQVIADRA